MTDLNPKLNGQVSIETLTPQKTVNADKILEENKELKKLFTSVVLVTKLALCGICIGIIGVLISVASIMISSYLSTHEKNQNVHQSEYSCRHYQPY